LNAHEAGISTGCEEEKREKKVRLSLAVLCLLPRRGGTPSNEKEERKGGKRKESGLIGVLRIERESVRGSDGIVDKKEKEGKERTRRPFSDARGGRGTVGGRAGAGGRKGGETRRRQLGHPKKRKG